MPRQHSKNLNLGSFPTTVLYTHTTGKTYSAIVTAFGAGNLMDLRVPSLKGTASYVLSGIDRQTTVRGGGGFLGRWSL